MASDTELERLAEIQQAAFAKLNVARDDMNQAQECRERRLGNNAKRQKSTTVLPG